MTAHERAVHWLTRRVEGRDAAYRRDVALTTCELCREAGRFRRCLELLSLVAFALRLRSRARTGDRPDAVWRQGVYVGAVVLLLSLAAESSAAGWDDTSRLGLAAMLAASVVSALYQRRLAAAGFAAGAAIVEVAWVSQGVQAGAFLSASLLVAGWFDPRLAAAATTIVFARLAASGFGELGRALAVLQQHGQRELLLRWLAMGSSVVGAWLVTHRSIRHIARL